MVSNKTKKKKRVNFQKYILFVRDRCYYSERVIKFLRVNNIKSKVVIKKDTIKNRKYIAHSERPKHQAHLKGLLTFPALQIRKGEVMLESENIMNFLEEKIINNLTIDIKRNIKTTI